ncbi:MAG: peptidase and DD-carboxypeptidase VanY/endolysin [Parcubacteria group bacterium]|nr:peptidase and DD-carboxypeptidase VanY/endolysin [Parcubacteria group bacterium]
MKSKLLFSLGALVLIAIVGYGIYDHRHLRQENLLLGENMKAASTSLAELENRNVVLEGQLQSAEDTLTSFGAQVSDLTGTVGTLKKLSETDQELLKKYSKVYFLNENYIPSGLSEIDQKYVYTKGKVLEIHTKVKPHLESLIDAANSTGLNLLVISAYRSFGTQSSLKSSYKVTYGAGTANSFSADQGYSEHQLGTAVDFTTPKVGDTFSGFSKAPEYQWLVNNAYRYGFILSYPEGNTYYTFEPWHWRFVGTALALMLHNENRRFYDLDQREIDKYLVTIFD